MTAQRNSAGHGAKSLQALRIAYSPIAEINPESSAIVTNFSGDINLLVGWFQRNSASKPARPRARTIITAFETPISAANLVQSKGIRCNHLCLSVIVLSRSRRSGRSRRNCRSAALSGLSDCRIRSGLIASGADFKAVRATSGDPGATLLCAATPFGTDFVLVDPRSWIRFWWISFLARVNSKVIIRRLHDISSARCLMTGCALPICGLQCMS